MPSTRACGASHLPRDNGCSLRELKSLNVGIRAKRVSRTELTRIKHWRFTINPESDVVVAFRRTHCFLFHKCGEPGFADLQHHTGIPVSNFTDIVFSSSSKHLRNL